MSAPASISAAEGSGPWLALDEDAEIERIAVALRGQLRAMRKRGIVLGLSGGIDSSVSLGLAVRAVGAGNVFCVLMPEADSDPESLRLGRLAAETFGVEAAVGDIGPTLRAMGCYERRDAFIRELVPDYGLGWASKVVIADTLEGGGYNISSLTVSEISDDDLISRITIVTEASAPVMEQIIAQLERLVPVHKVTDLTAFGPHVERELALVKVAGTGEHRIEALRLAEVYRARVVDATTASFVFEVTGGSEKLDKFVELMRDLGLVEVARTGIVAIARGAEAA